MGIIKPPVDVKLITGIIYNPSVKMEMVMGELVKNFGEIDNRSEKIEFNFTEYYCKEMGRGLMRFWVSFENLIPAENIHLIKHKTNSIESIFSINNSRMVNLDPGYICASRLILLSTKDYSHRIYLGNGIYAEVTLIYRNQKFHPLEWTYPDYRINLALGFFEKVRAVYLKQLRDRCML